MQENEKEEYFYQITNQSKNQDKDVSSLSEASKNTKSFDSTMANLLENAIMMEDFSNNQQFQRQSQQIADEENIIQGVSMQPNQQKLQQAEEQLRQKKYMYVSYIQPDSSFRHQIKLINRNVKYSAKTKEMLNFQIKPPNHLQYFNSYYDQSLSASTSKDRNSSQNFDFRESKNKFNSKENVENSYVNPLREYNASVGVRSSQLDQNSKYQSNSVIDEQQEEEQVMTTSQFRDKKISKVKKFQSVHNQFSIDIESISPSAASNPINRYSFIPNSEVAKIFGIIPSTTTSKKTNSNLQSNLSQTDAFLTNTFNYTRKLYLIVVLIPTQFMIELKQLKMFYEPLELVSMNKKRQGGCNKTLTRKLDMNTLSERLIKYNDQFPSYKIKTIHVPVKGQIVDIKNDGAWAQIKRNMDNFFEDLDDISQFLNGSEKKPLKELNFDCNLFDITENKGLRKKFNFPSFVQKNQTKNNSQKQDYCFYYDNLLQKIQDLNDLPYSDLDMNQNLMIASASQLEYINLTDIIFENTIEDQARNTNFEYLKQKILNQKPRQKSSYEPRKADIIHQQSSQVSNHNKSFIISDHEKKSASQLNQDKLHSSQVTSKIQTPVNYKDVLVNSPSQKRQKSPSDKREKSPFVPYLKRNQNEQLWSDSKKNYEDQAIKEESQNQNMKADINNHFTSLGLESIDDTLLHEKNKISSSLNYYKQTENKIFQFNPLEENMYSYSRNSSCRNSSAQKNKLSPLSRLNNQQLFDKFLIQKIQKQAKKIKQINVDSSVDSISVFPKQFAVTTTAYKANGQTDNNFNEDKVIYPFKSKWIKVRKNVNIPKPNTNQSPHLNHFSSVNASINLNAQEKLKLYSGQGQELPQNFTGEDKIPEYLKQNVISQTVNVNNQNYQPQNQLHQSNSFQPNSQAFEMNFQLEDEKILLNQIKQTYDSNNMNQTFNNNKLRLSKKQEYKRTLVNQVHDAKFAEQFHKEFLKKFGFSSSRQISEILYKDAFFNYTKEELDIMFGQFLILANHCQRFMEKPLLDFLQEFEQKEQISMKQKTIYLFQKCLHTKLSILKETFTVFKRLKELQVLKPALKFILLNNELVDQQFDSGKEVDIQFYWKDFLRFKAFIVEQKWSRFDKISFLLSIINPNNEQYMSLKQINTIFPDNMKVTDPKQIKLMKEFLFNQQFLVEGNKVAFSRISDCLQKEFFLNINDIINHFLTKQ
ncbi:hypothetical protein ABPG74_018412 [Tetrahymena malaccensis]